MYFMPRTLDEAVQALSAGEAAILAGGTDFYPSRGLTQVKEPVVDLSRIDGLAGVTKDQDRFKIGACTTWTQLIRTELPRCFDGLKAAAREVGSIQIQNCGTIGGNLCNASPAADGVPPLLALDAEVELTSASARRRLPLSEFIHGSRRTALQRGEILTSVLVPRRFETAVSSFLKLGARRYLVISISTVAATVVVDKDGTVAEARVAVGACSPVAQRLVALDSALKGSRVVSGWGLVAEPHHLVALSPIDDVRATCSYRRDATLTLVRRALEACVKETHQ
jgi:CO/xanthine dehydrogenase FAD-binding subunit